MEEKNPKKPRLLCREETHLEVRTSTISQTAPDDDEIPVNLLKKCFHAAMKTDSVPLLASWQSYSKMLPVRESLGDSKMIAEFPFWAKAEEVTHLAKLLERGEVLGPQRAALPYLCAPSHSGKTACILVGFLNSFQSTREGKFTFYFYLPFHNNKGKNFAYNEGPNQRKPAKISGERQGAHFAFQCVKFLLEQGPLVKQQVFDYIMDHENLRSVEETSQAIDGLLNEKLPGEHRLVLFHVDEHRQMNIGDENFRRGALQALSLCRRAECVATYTEIPLEVGTHASSAVCRRPVPKPAADISQVMANVSELDMTIIEHNTPESARKWATLVFRLAMKISPIMMNVHMKIPAIKKFLENLNKARKNNDIDQCLKLCYVDLKMNVGNPQKGAVHLMVGICDENLSKFDYKLPGLTVVNGMIMATLGNLTMMDDNDYPIFGQGRRRFAQSLNESKRTDDILTATPLEAAFSWSLACRTCVQDTLVFSDHFQFAFRPANLQSGRLFPTSDNQQVLQNFEVEVSKGDTLYFVEEKKRRGEKKESHPLCDMFFRTDSDELVLIDVTGGIRDVDRKVEKLKNWLESDAARQLPCQKKFGIVLAPAKEEPTYEDETVCAVLGKDARRLLGALSQCFEWFVP